LDPHHPHADGLEALVATAGNRRVPPFFVDGDRHAQLGAVEIDNRRADHGMTLETIGAEIGLCETRRERLVRRARMPAQFARPFMQHVAPLLRDFPAGALLLERGSIGRRFELEGAFLGHPTLPSSEIASSFCASTANSIGSSFSTSLAKPLTISATASSSG